MYKKKPFFIVFEGVEGCGKSFQSKKLYNNLKKNKLTFILTREPGGTKSSELIRNLILKIILQKIVKKNLTSIQILCFILLQEMNILKIR